MTTMTALSTTGTAMSTKRAPAPARETAWRYDDPLLARAELYLRAAGVDDDALLGLLDEVASALRRTPRYDKPARVFDLVRELARAHGGAPLYHASPREVIGTMAPQKLGQMPAMLCPRWWQALGRRAVSVTRLTWSRG